MVGSGVVFFNFSYYFIGRSSRCVWHSPITFVGFLCHTFKWFNFFALGDFVEILHLALMEMIVVALSQLFCLRIDISYVYQWASYIS